MNKRPGELGSPGRLLPWVKKRLAQTGVDRAEDLADLTAQQRQNTNDNNCNQHQNQRVLDQSLSIFRGEEAPNDGHVLLRCTIYLAQLPTLVTPHATQAIGTCEAHTTQSES